MTEYVVLIVGDGDRWWTSMSLKERQDGYAEYARFGEELGRRGHKITVEDDWALGRVCAAGRRTDGKVCPREFRPGGVGDGR